MRRWRQRPSKGISMVVVDNQNFHQLFQELNVSVGKDTIRNLFDFSDLLRAKSRAVGCIDEPKIGKKFDLTSSSDDSERRRMVEEIESAMNYSLIIENGDSPAVQPNDSQKLSESSECSIQTGFRSPIEKQSQSNASDDFRISKKSIPFSSFRGSVFKTSTPVDADSTAARLTVNSQFVAESNESAVKTPLQSSSEANSGIESLPSRSHRRTQLTILQTPRHWGLIEELHSRILEKEKSLPNESSRSFSLCEENKDHPPFYLATFQWSAKYAERRNYKNELLFLCQQKGIPTWNQSRNILDISTPLKLGEGTFGEVFLTKFKDITVALKIIPIGGTVVVNGDRQKSFGEIVPEVVVSKELSDLQEVEDGCSSNGFVKMIGAMVVKGAYPDHLICAWEKFHQENNSENDHPRIFPKNQNYLLLAFENGGIDLERYKIKNIMQSHSIVYQVMIAIIVAEQRLCFEHRDLHCGNILVDEVEQSSTVSANIYGIRVDVLTHGAQVKVIDFSLSRLSKGSTTIFMNLANDDEIFEGSGHLQFDIYRAMKESNRNEWRPFKPQTNIMWLIYLVRYLNEVHEKNSIGDVRERYQFVKHFQNLHHFARLHDWFAQYGEESNLVTVDGDFAV